MTNRLATLVIVSAFAVGPAAAVCSAAGLPDGQPITLNASDAESGSRFGASVDLSENTAITGAVWDNHAGFYSGAAYLFDASTGQERFKLTAADTVQGDTFGTSVAVSGGTAIVGAPNNKPAGLLYSTGAAYLFDVITGQQNLKLIASDAGQHDSFGTSSSISGNVAIVGAPKNTNVQPAAGAAYLFDVTTGHQISKLSATDPGKDDWFGYSVAIDGNRAIVGALFDDGTRTDSGAAYVFDVTTGQQLFKLTANDPEPNAFFGASVAISGNLAIVGAAEPSLTIKGSAYVFDVTTGQQLFKLTPTNGALYDGFGASVAISGNLGLVGADDFFHHGQSSAYLFSLTNGGQLAKLTAQTGGWSGWSVALNGSTALIGDPKYGNESGAAYLIAVPEPGGISLLGNMLGALLTLLRRPTKLRNARSASGKTADQKRYGRNGTSGDN